MTGLGCDILGRTKGTEKQRVLWEHVIIQVEARLQHDDCMTLLLKIHTFRNCPKSTNLPAKLDCGVIHVMALLSTHVAQYTYSTIKSNTILLATSY